MRRRPLALWLTAGLAALVVLGAVLTMRVEGTDEAAGPVGPACPRGFDEASAGVAGGLAGGLTAREVLERAGVQVVESRGRTWFYDLERADCRYLELTFDARGRLLAAARRQSIPRRQGPSPPPQRLMTLQPGDVRILLQGPETRDVHGYATLRPAGTGRTLVVLQRADVGLDTTAAVVTSHCRDRARGRPAHGLEPPFTGNSRTMLGVPLDSLLSARYSIELDSGGAHGGDPIACGDIRRG